MSMTTLTLLQLIEIFGVYTLMAVIVPAMILHKRVATKKLSVRFMIYLTVGNFYMMNIVYLLELLHIAYCPVLILITVALIVFGIIIGNQMHLSETFNLWYEYLNKLSLGYIGVKSFRRVIWGWFHKQWKRMTSWMKKYLLKHWCQWILIAFMFALLSYIFASNSFINLGYCASDLPVHNYWINEMGKNNIFVAGVYPFGFHCVVYFIHSVFAIDTYVILKLFGFVQLCYVVAALLAFLQGVCKTKYAPILGSAAYFALNIWDTGAFSRFHSGLPQEFGMIFILPGIYFLFEFFHTRKQEDLSVKAPKGKKRFDIRIWQPSTWCLVLFAFNFSMTLAAHFYVTMIIGLYCLGIGIGFLFRFLRKGYFWRIMAAGCIAIFIAVLPMGVAFVTGTPLQGSLNWGLSVMTGTTDYEETEDTSEETDTNTDTTNDVTDSEATDTSTDTDNADTVQDASSESTADSNQSSVNTNFGITAKIMRIPGYITGTLIPSMNTMIDEYLMRNEWNGFHNVIYLLMGICLLGGVLMLPKDREYTMLVVSSVVYMILMLILFASGLAGLPELMDGNRSRIFVAYSIPIIGALAVDGVIAGTVGYLKYQWMMQLVSLACLLGGIYVASDMNWIREPDYVKSLESNGAITCLSNIIHDEKDGTWTIVSANDELRMGEDHGYHYETITFLRMMEMTQESVDVTIPTNRVFFFIEKVPIDYQTTYEKSGQSISEEGAANALPSGDGLGVYQMENRWIVMSRMYYWAKQYQQLYPNEMKVYYEDDDFICYVIDQNGYSLNNFDIDYGYNMVTYDAEEQDGE